MSRRRDARREPHRLPPADSIPTPITAIPQLAEAARRRGETDRVIWVDGAEPQQVRTPGRRVGQWLMSGKPLSSALADAVERANDREEYER